MIKAHIIKWRKTMETLLYNPIDKKFYHLDKDNGRIIEKDNAANIITFDELGAEKLNYILFYNRIMRDTAP
jgi:hypothetical protein